MFHKLLQSAARLIPYRLRSCIRHTPGLKQLQQFLMRQYLDGTSFVHNIKGGPADGLNYPVALPQDKQIWLGNYEQNFCEALAAQVIPGMVCYDIGGYRGFFSGVLGRQGAGSIAVFEPFPANQLQIRAMIQLNPSLPITLYPFALADKAGSTSFAVMPEGSMGKLEESKFDSGDHPFGIITVQVETLDELIRSRALSPANLIKIDVEGAELLVLKGAEGLIETHHPVLFIEAHSRELARGCSDFLLARGYQIKVMETGRHLDYCTEPVVCHLHAAVW
jgi:FkbM family methyltransferase